MTDPVYFSAAENDEDAVGTAAAAALPGVAAAVSRAADRYQFEGCPVSALRKDVFPEGDARERLYAFLGKHQPLAPEVGCRANILDGNLPLLVNPKT